MATVPTRDPWTDLLQQGRDDERLVREAYEGPRPAEQRPVPEELHPLVDPGALADSRDRRALQPPGRGAPRRLGGPDHRHHRHRERQVALLPAAHARRPLPGRQSPRALPLPDQGARPGSGPLAQPLRADQAGPPRDLRRRHPEGGARADPPAQQPDPHEPGHAPHRDPPEPPRLGRALQPSRGRRRGRGARLPRRLRLPRRERAQTAAQDRERLRHRAPLPARERDHREPRRARREAHGPRPGRPRRRGRFPRLGPQDRDVEPARHRRGHPDPPPGAERGGGAPGRPGPRGRPDHLLHPLAEGRGGRGQGRP